MRYRLDSSWWRTRGTDTAGRSLDTVVAGSPLRLFRLGAGGTRLADVLTSDGSVPSGTESLAERFVAAGAIHPEPDEPLDPSAVTVVIPAHDERHVDLAVLAASLSRFARVIVVDDGSTPALAPIDGALVVRREHAGGPGAARNTGAALAETEFVLFVDADTVWNEDAEIVFSHFIDSRVVAVAPRVASESGPSLIARYEASESPLDLGVEPARVHPNTRVSYVPSAALAVRRSVFEALGGFDESLRYGEDVDFVWRAVEQGHVVRYDPRGTVHHRPRTTFDGFVRQRIGYGSSAASLAIGHDGAVTPLRVNRWSAAAWTAVALGRPFVGTTIGAVSTALLPRKLGSGPDRNKIALHLAGRGNLHAGRLVAAAITRTWLPIVVLIAPTSRHARRTLLAALTIPAVWSWFERRPDVDLPRYVALRALDDASYCAGVWKGIVRSRDARRLGAIRPRFE